MTKVCLSSFFVYFFLKKMSSPIAFFYLVFFSELRLFVNWRLKCFSFPLIDAPYHAGKFSFPADPSFTGALGYYHLRCGSRIAMVCSPDYSIRVCGSSRIASLVLCSLEAVTVFCLSCD